MFEVKIEVNYERKMSKSLDVLAIPVVSNETFVEQEFEKRYVHYAQTFG